MTACKHYVIMLKQSLSSCNTLLQYLRELEYYEEYDFEKMHFYFQIYSEYFCIKKSAAAT